MTNYFKHISFLFTVTLLLSLCVQSTITLVRADGNASITQNSQTNNIDLDNLAREYKGVDLASKNFDRSKMNSEEQALLDKLLNYEASQVVHKGQSDQEFKIEMEHTLSSSNFTGNTGTDFSTVKAKKHGTISNGVLGGTLNVVIDSALILSGYGSVSALVKTAGKKAAAKIISKSVITKVKGKLSSMGLKRAAVVVGGVSASQIIAAAVNPGGWIATWLDNRDNIPGNGYQEWW